MTVVRWLDEDEQLAWRSFITGAGVLQQVLNRELMLAHDLSHDDYGILAMLSEAPDRRLLFKDLAATLHVAPAHITYRFRRLEARGLVTRCGDPSDGRRAFAELTDAGWACIVAAAPTHVTGVREHFLDAITREELLMIGEAMAKVLRDLTGVCEGEELTHT